MTDASIGATDVIGRSIAITSGGKKNATILALMGLASDDQRCSVEASSRRSVASHEPKDANSRDRSVAAFPVDACDDWSVSLLRVANRCVSELRSLQLAVEHDSFFRL